MLGPAAARLRGWAWRATPALRWRRALHDRSRSVLCGLAGPASFLMKSRPAGSGAAGGGAAPVGRGGPARPGPGRGGPDREGGFGNLK